MATHEQKTLPLLICCLILIGAYSIGFLPVAAQQFEISQESTYITYFGGTNVEDATKVAFDQEGNTILIGQTQSTNLPVTDNAFQTDAGGDWDAFIAKFSSTGALLFSSYLGGSGYEHVTSINVDAGNNIIVAGTTQSSGLPTTIGALHESPLGLTDGFIFKLAPNGTVLFGTYFGGSGEDWIYGMEFDASGDYMFSGWTNTVGLGTSGAYQQSFGGGVADAFVARVSADGSTLQMFSYIGGSGDDKAWSMTSDGSYNYIISGVASTGFPITGGAYQSSHGGGYDAYLTKVSASGNTLVFSTFLGGTNDDLGLGVDVDSHGNIILTGDTQSDNINTINAIQQDFAGGSNDFFASKFNATGYPYFITYIGGNQTDRCWDARVDIDDNLVLIGRTNSADFPAFNGMNDTLSGGFDACATKLSSDGQTIIASTFIGGSSEDIGEGIAIDNSGDIVVTGRTWSMDFPVTDGAYQEDKGGLSDVFICHAPFQSREVTETTTPPTTYSQPVDGDVTLFYVALISAIIIVVLAIVLLRKK